MSWWSKATTEQRLAQIDGGIECGMSANHIGMNCGTSASTCGAFGRNHGRSFPNKNGRFTKQAKDTAYILSSRRAAELTGKSETQQPAAFAIFGKSSTPKHLFDASPVD